MNEELLIEALEEVWKEILERQATIQVLPNEDIIDLAKRSAEIAAKAIAEGDDDVIEEIKLQLKAVYEMKRIHLQHEEVRIIRTTVDVAVSLAKRLFFGAA